MGTTSDAAQLLDERYELVDELGEGSFGVVYRARDQKHSRRVAVKLLRYEETDADVEEMRDRLRRETEVVSDIAHPHAVQALDFGHTPEAFYTVMEFVDGEVLRRRIRQTGGLETSTVVRVAAATLDVLHVAHREGIVHRDLKPANIVLCEAEGIEDFPKVMDFSTAKPVEETSKLTDAGQALGSPAYMAPELIEGHDPQPASDLYTLGLTLAEALSGQKVVSASNPIACAKMQAAPDPLELPEQLADHPLEPWIARAVAKDRDERFGSAAEMLTELQGLDVDVPVDGLKLTWLESAGPEPKTQKIESVPRDLGNSSDGDSGEDSDHQGGKTVPLEAVSSDVQAESAEPDVSNKTVPLQSVSGDEAILEGEVSGEAVSSRPSADEPKDEGAQEVEQTQPDLKESYSVGSVVGTVGDRFKSGATGALQAVSPDDDQEGPSRIVFIPTVIIGVLVAAALALFAFGIHPTWLAMGFWPMLAVFVVLGVLNIWILK